MIKTLFKNSTPISKIKDAAPTIDSCNIQSTSITPNLNFQTKPEENPLEIRIINTTDQYQEIEITYGKKKKRLRITKFLPKNLANDYLYHPLPSGVGATHLASLKQNQQTQNLPLREKLLNVLAKINFLYQDNNGNELQDSNLQKIWDGPERINIDQNFLALSKQQQQALLDKESAKRSPYLSTPEKAILVAAINQLRETEKKFDRDFVSYSFAEIPDKNLFKEFIKEINILIENKQKLLDNFFVTKPQNFSPEKNNNLLKQVTEIFSEADESRRKHKIHSLKKIIDQNSTKVIAK